MQSSEGMCLNCRSDCTCSCPRLQIDSPRKCWTRSYHNQCPSAKDARPVPCPGKALVSGKLGQLSGFWVGSQFGIQKLGRGPPGQPSEGQQDFLPPELALWPHWDPTQPLQPTSSLGTQRNTSHSACSPAGGWQDDETIHFLCKCSPWRWPNSCKFTVGGKDAQVMLVIGKWARPWLNKRVAAVGPGCLGVSWQNWANQNYH